VEVQAPPAAEAPVALERTEADSLRSRVLQLSIEQWDRELEHMRFDGGEMRRCVFYFDPNDRPASERDGLRPEPAKPVSIAEVDRLANDIAARRATILDDRQLAAFDRDVVNRFEDVRARIRKFDRR